MKGRRIYKPCPIKNYQIETRDFSEINHTKISGYLYNRKYCSYNE